jgi:glucosamine-6-phosphate deaminase
MNAPRLTVFADESTLARELAQRLVAIIRERPTMVLGLPTGRTPVRLYHELAARHRRGEVDLSRVQTFNLDEFLGVPPSHPGSYRTFMQTHLFGRVNIPPGAVHFLDGSAADPDAECQRYEAAIVDAGGIDLQIVGIGTNGHIGFNEPAPELAARTHRVRPRASTRRSNAALFGGDPDRVPEEALSMGMATILQARRIWLIATGKSKAACVRRVLEGGVTTKLPASFLQLHPDAEIIVDDKAASFQPPAASA